MKKIRFIVAICLMTIAVSVYSQNITPVKLKQARMAAYEWVDDYIAKIPYEKAKRADRQLREFIDLFASDSTVIYNDLYAMPNYNFDEAYMSAYLYGKQAQDETMFFKYFSDVENIEIVSESYQKGRLIYVLHFDKRIKAVERYNLSDSRYIYPEREIGMECVLECDINSEEVKMLATSIRPVNEVLPFIVCYNGLDSYYTTEEEIEEMNIATSTPMVKTSLSYPIQSIDNKIVVVERDTIKQNLHVSPYLGGLLYTFDMLNTDSTVFGNTYIHPSLSVGFGIGYYYQYKLTNKYRLGMEINASYLYNMLDFYSTYYTAYDAIDPANSKYERRIKLDNYNEVIHNHTFYLTYTPIRHDILFRSNNHHWSFYWSLGVYASFSLKQYAQVTADAECTGYYDWLLNVEFVDKVYDFGTYTLSKSTNQIALKKINVGLLASVGFQYFIPRSHWSIEPSIRFLSSLYMPIEKENNFHIIDSSGKWRSASYLFNRMYMQNIGFQLNINYNF